MNSQQLAYFCKVAERGSFSRAASDVGINQSVLSRHIGKLEEELGVRLLYRNGRGAVTTESGKRLYARGIEILAAMDAAEHEASCAGESRVERAVIGLPPSVGRAITQPLARNLTDTFPDIKLQFMETHSEHLIECLDAGHIDVGILYESWATHRLNAETVARERMYLVASAKEKKLGKTSPTAILARVPLILPSAGHGLRRLIDSICVEQGYTLSVKIEANSFNAIINLVKANLGYSIFPASAVLDEIQRGELQASLLQGPEVARNLIIATPNHRPPIRGLFQVTSAIKNQLAKMERGRIT